MSASARPEETNDAGLCGFTLAVWLVTSRVSLPPPELDPWRFKNKTGMRNILAFIACVTVCTSSLAIFWQDKISVLCSESVLHEFELKDGRIVLTLSVLEAGKSPRPFSREKLEECKIKDIKNWSCGGKITNDFFGRSAFSAAHMVVDGKYHYLPSTFYPRTGFCQTHRQLD